MTKQLSLIVAVGNHNVMGYQNKLPWHLSADLKYFKATTMGKPIIMGRKTYESIGNPLPGRQNIVITHQQTLNIPECNVVHSLEAALDMTKDAHETMIIGGANIFQQALPIATRLYLTIIHHDFEGDTFFPAWNENHWEVMQREDFIPDERNPYAYSFVMMQRK